MKFSIVIPLYNKEYSVVRCLKSVLSQNYPYYEVIIINDGSTDKSLEVVRNNFKYEISNGIITIVNQYNQGVSVARNHGASLANNEYLCFLDADDEWSPSFLQTMALLIEDYPDATLYSLGHKLKIGDSALSIPKHGLTRGYRGYVNNFFQSSCEGIIVKTSAACIRKTNLLMVGGFPEGIVAGEDIYLWMRLALIGKVACDMKYLAIAHIQKDNSRNARSNSIPYPLNYFSKHPEYLEEPYLKKYLFVIFYKHFLHSLLNFRIKEASLRFKSFIEIYK